jgi:hypothetical protein
MEISRATLSALVPKLEYAFDLRPQFAVSRPAGTFAKGGREFAKIAGGTVDGPLLQGELIGGASFPLRLQGDLEYLEFDERMLIRTADGATIYVQNRGTLVATPAEYYHRGTPVFDAPVDGPHDWLNHHMFVASGGRRLDGSGHMRVFVVR